MVITSTDPILARLNFRPYRYKGERRVVPFLPGPDEPQMLEIRTGWGETLTAHKGDFLLAEVDTPNDYWPIDPLIFEESHILIRPGYTVKKAVAYLVPLADVTGGDPDLQVTIKTLEGTVTVRAGDFYLARGVRGEIWPILQKKVEVTMFPAEEADEQEQSKQEKSNQIDATPIHKKSKPRGKTGRKQIKR